MARGLGRERVHSGKEGFTLLEMLAAFAIASVIILATAALLHNLAVPFARGTSRVANGERLALAAERLATDIGSARFILQPTSAGPSVAFLGETRRVTFIGVSGLDAPLRGQVARSAEVVSFDIEADGDATHVVRRRAPWLGARTQFQDAALGDQVVLLAGAFEAAFSFARAAPDGALTWVNSWANEPALPRLVKLSLRDRTSGIDLFGGATFAIHANAPPACALQDAAKDCLSSSTSDDQRPVKSASQQR